MVCLELAQTSLSENTPSVNKTKENKTKLVSGKF